VVAVTGDPRAGLEALRAAADGGALAELCRRHGIRLFVVFGSVLDPGRVPRDLDVAVAFEPGATPDILGLIDDLAALTGVESVDVLDLGRAGPVARERALVATLPLYESRAGVFANTQLAAMTERMETDWLRRLDLELMGS
jgi:predicted nucleotidyltransferase